jgi:hypothetical protein
MKKLYYFIIICSFLLIAASPDQVNLVRFTVINKSGLPMEVKLTGQNDENFYYLRIPAGDRSSPSETVFTIVRDIYRMQPYYIELWDPVYGYSCGGASGKTLYAFRNIQITFVECGVTPRHKGEPAMMKFSPRWRYIY